MIKNCEICSKQFITYRSKVSIGKGKFCSKKCANFSFKGKSFSPATQFPKCQKPHNFKGWRLHQARKNGSAYKEIYLPQHPQASKAGYVREHRLLIEKKLGRFLTMEEVIHHKNGDTLDNRLENLELMTAADHRREHLKDNVHKRWVA